MTTEKLVRDRIPVIDRLWGGDPSRFRTAPPDEMTVFLLAKLREEVEEVAGASGDEIAEEVGDVIEVALALAALHGHTVAYINAVRHEKTLRRGGFHNRQVLRLD